MDKPIIEDVYKEIFEYYSNIIIKNREKLLPYILNYDSKYIEEYTPIIEWDESDKSITATTILPAGMYSHDRIVRFADELKRDGKIDYATSIHRFEDDKFIVVTRKQMVKMGIYNFYKHFNIQQLCL